MKKKIGFFCDFCLFLSLPNQALKIMFGFLSKITEKSDFFFQQGVLLFVYFYLHSKVPYLTMGKKKDLADHNLWTALCTRLG